MFIAVKQMSNNFLRYVDIGTVDVNKWRRGLTPKDTLQTYDVPHIMTVEQTHLRASSRHSRTNQDIF